MSRHAFLFCIGCLIVLALAVANARPTSALDDSSQFQQSIRDLSSNEAAVRKSAAEKLATAEAIPCLVQAVQSAEKVIAEQAAEILVTLLDANQTELAAAAETAVAELEKSTDEDVVGRMRILVERRQAATVEKLKSLGAEVSHNDRGVRIDILPERWKGGDDSFAYLQRLRGPLTVQIAFGREPALQGEGWRGSAGVMGGWMRVADARPVTPPGLAALRGMVHVQSLSLTMLPASSDLSLLVGLPSLRRLSLDLSSGDVENALTQVAKLNTLERLGLFHVADLDQQLKVLAAIPALKEITVQYSAPTATGSLEQLALLSQLASIELTNAGSLSSQLPALAGLPHLRRLSVAGRIVTDGDLEAIGKLTHLEELTLLGTSVTDDGLAHLADLSQLRQLSVPGTTLTDDAVPHLQKLRGLQSLAAWGSFLTPMAATKLKQYFPDIRINGASYSPPPNAEERQRIRELIRLGAGIWATQSDRPGVPRGQVEVVVTLYDDWRGGREGLQLLTKLERVDILDIRAALPDAAADNLQRLQSLQEIRLSDTGLTDEGLRFLPQLTNLRRVRLEGPFTDAAAKYLSRMAASELTLAQTAISEETRKAIDAALQPNRQAAQRMAQTAEMEELRALVVQACTPLADDRPASAKAREERSRAQGQIAMRRMEAIPLVADVAQFGASPARVEALLLLHRLGCRNLSWGTGTPSDEVVAEVQEAFRGLAAGEAQPSSLERTDEEQALLDLGKWGGRIIQGPGGGRLRIAYQVFISSDWTGGDAGLSCLTHLQPLRYLGIYGVTISREGLAVIQTLTDLTHLHLGVSDPEIPCFTALRGLTQLVTLEIATPLSDSALQGLGGLDNLQALALNEVSDTGLQYIGQLPQLTGLSFSGAPDFTGAGLRHLAGASQLASIEIHDAPALTVVDFQGWAAASPLGNFSLLNAPRFTGAGLETLAAVKSLKTLSLCSVGALGPALTHVAELPGLQELRLADVPLTREDLEHIARAQQLKRLSLNRTTLVDQDLQYLVGLPPLERLDLSSNAISDDGLAYLSQLRPTQDFHLDYTFVSDDGKAKLAPTGPGARPRPRRSANNPSRAQARPAVTPEYLATVREIVGLGACVWPRETGCTVSLFAQWKGGEEKLALLDKLGDVQQLSIKSPVTDTSLRYLKRLTHLEHLRFDCASLTDAALEELKHSLPKANIVVLEQH